MAAQNTTIKVPSMMGGVSKSSPSKRRPDQVEEAENVFLSAEEGLQKRQATKFMPLTDATLKGKLDITGASPSHELIYYEFRLAKNKSALIVINVFASTPSDRVQIFDATTGNKKPEWLSLTGSSQETSFFNYLIEGSLPPLERLRLVRIKSSLAILNVEVEAKFLNINEGQALEYTAPRTTLRFEGNDGTTSTKLYFEGIGLYPRPGVVRGTTDDTGSNVGQIKLKNDSFIDCEDAIGRPIDPSANQSDNTGQANIKFTAFEKNHFDYDNLIKEPSSLIDRQPNTDTGVMVDTQDSIAVNFFFEVGGAPDAPRSYDTSTTHIDGKKEHHFPIFRTPFIRNSDPVRQAMVALHSNGVQEATWTFQVNDNLTQNPADRTAEPRFGSALFGSPHLGDGFIFEVKNAVAGAPRGFYRTIATPAGNEFFKTTSNEFKTDSNGNILFEDPGATDNESVNGEGPVVYKPIFCQLFPRINSSDYSPQFSVSHTNELPFYQRIRSPERGSVLDRSTFPHLIAFNNKTNPNETRFAIGQLPLTPRFNGDNTTNPGPSFIANTADPYSTTAPTGAKISSIGYWRNRLWLASGTTIVSSQAGNQYSLFIDDADTLTERDPLDISLSDSDAATINWIVPFERSLFLGTDGSQQFVLTGSDNFISPTTAALDSTSQHSISAASRPFKVGPFLFFSDAGRLFLYQGKAGEGEGRSIDVSSHVLGYFPNNISQSVSVPEEDIILFKSSDVGDEKTIYVMRRYTTDTQGNFASAFWKWKFRETVENFYSFGSEVYVILKDSDNKRQIEKLPIRATSVTDTLLDGQQSITGSYSATTGKTTWTLDFDPTEAIGVYEKNKQAFSSFDITVNGNQWLVSVSGDFSEAPTTFGFKYDMEVELSPFILRDGNNVTSDASLQIKDLATRHFNTGTYEIGVSRRGRYETKATFDPYRTTNPFITEDESYFQENGQAQARISGSADDISIKLKSDGFVPVNITNVEARVTAQIGRDTAID